MNRTWNFLSFAVHDYIELYRSYHRGQLSGPSRDIMVGECKQKRELARLSGGNQLRNCWSQAVLTGPCGGGGGGTIYQINRGEEAISSAPDDGTSVAQAGSICQEVTRCRRPNRQCRRRKWKATYVSRVRTRGKGGGRGREKEGGPRRPRALAPRVTRYQNQLSIGSTRYRGYRGP